MELNVNDKSFCLTACLVPDKNGDKGFLQNPLLLTLAHSGSKLMTQGISLPVS